MRAYVICVLALGCSSPTNMPAEAGADTGTGADALADTSMDAGGNMCSAVVQQFLSPVDMVSPAEVVVVSDVGGTKTLYVDATAGGFQPTEARVYVSLSTAKRVDITDKQAPSSAMWDLAFKRYVIFTNSGDAGVGMGGAIALTKDFDQVTMADATGKTFSVEQFVDKDCNPIMDQLGGVKTTFSDWYTYNMQTMAVGPKANMTYLVRAAGGAIYKLTITSYYGATDGGMGATGARYLVKYAAL